MDPRFDIGDADEHTAVAAILAELPADHPARAAYADHECTIALSRLTADRMDVAERLKEAYLDGYRRLLHGQGHFRPIASP